MLYNPYFVPCGVLAHLGSSWMTCQWKVPAILIVVNGIPINIQLSVFVTATKSKTLAFVPKYGIEKTICCINCDDFSYNNSFWVGFRGWAFFFTIPMPVAVNCFILPSSTCCTCTISHSFSQEFQALGTQIPSSAESRLLWQGLSLVLQIFS